MIIFRRTAAKSAALLIIAVCLFTPAAACIPTPPSNTPPPVNPLPPSPVLPKSPAPAASQQAAANNEGSQVNVTDTISQPQPVRSVEIKLIHHRGTLTRIGCCNPLLYERDEFVVIQNLGDTPQDITGWSLANITRGYPTFRFPQLFPCIPQVLRTTEEEADVVVPESTYTIVQNPAQSVTNRLSPSNNTEKPTNEPVSEIDWSSCSPLAPLDQTPMKPADGQQGKPVPCILYPGQTILVFTDEVHCDSGGFSFNWGQGNIWNNETPDTAVLYDSQGKEISRRSYTVGR